MYKITYKKTSKTKIFNKTKLMQVISLSYMRLYYIKILLQQKISIFIYRKYILISKIADTNIDKFMFVMCFADSN